MFVRCAFRFFLGRQALLGDAVTLHAADAAHVEVEGSTKTLVAKLL